MAILSLAKDNNFSTSFFCPHAKKILSPISALLDFIISWQASEEKNFPIGPFPIILLFSFSKSYSEENDTEYYRTTALRGPSAGFTLELPMLNGSTFGLDYSYRHTDPFQGSHSIGARINL